MFEFSGTTIDLIQQLEIQYKRDERIIRFLTVSLDKHAAAYADKRKGLAKESAKKKKETV